MILVVEFCFSDSSSTPLPTLWSLFSSLLSPAAEAAYDAMPETGKEGKGGEGERERKRARSDEGQ